MDWYAILVVHWCFNPLVHCEFGILFYWVLGSLLSGYSGRMECKFVGLFKLYAFG